MRFIIIDDLSFFPFLFALKLMRKRNLCNYKKQTIMVENLAIFVNNPMYRTEKISSSNALKNFYGLYIF